MRGHCPLVLTFLLFCAGASLHAQEPGNLTWDVPGPTSAESMPLGNGDIGLNVWVEPGGDLVFYIGKTDSWGADVDGAHGSGPWGPYGLMKVGGVRVSLGDHPVFPFSQTLRLLDGDILVKEGNVEIHVWVDAGNPVIHVDTKSPHAISEKVSLYNWRKDTVLGAEKSELTWYHRDPDNADPHVAGLTFGARIKGRGMRVVDDTTLQASPSTTHQVSVYPLTVQAAIDDWKRSLDRETARLERLDPEKTLAAHRQWWKQFWDRSWIHITGDSLADAVTQGYTLQRFVSACSGRGKYPIKFNGSIFVVDNPALRDGNHTRSVSADYRAWGGQYWFQNTRPMYWPLLEEGDFDEMLPLFRMYARILHDNTKQVEGYYHHAGSYFAETAPFWGGLKYWGPEVKEDWTGHYFTPVLECSMMMLDYYAFTGDDSFAKEILVPSAALGLEFYDKHFKRDSAGKLLLDPDNSIEQFWKVHDPAPDIAGLHAVLARMLALPESLTTEARRADWRRLQSELPDLPTGSRDGQEVLLPYTGPQTAKPRNLENPELYAVYPFRLYGLGKPDLPLAINTFNVRKFKDKGCWVQDPIQAAMLGMADVAKTYVSYDLTRSDPRLKFPAFWIEGHDYVPDEDNGGNGENGLQDMLLQYNGRKIYVLPAWPKGWNASFKLHAPFNTTVEGKVVDGKLIDLIVTPASRKADVIDLSVSASAAYASPASGADAYAPPPPPDTDVCECQASRPPADDVAVNPTAHGPSAEGAEIETARAAASLATPGGALPPYLDPQVPIEDRITDLLPRLTLDEKVVELSDSWGSKGIPRLKIPAMLKTEGLHGQSYSTGATIFPEPISMSSTFDTVLIRKVGQATAVEAKAAGIRVTWSPVLDVARDARWGRVEETYGEDPYWVSRMGVAWIKGFQGEHMIVVPKHFAGHGEPLGGRDSHDVGLSDRVMRNIHLVPFRAAIEEAHAGGVMAAYSTWDGVPDNGSVELLQHILREEWGFDGMVVSDCGGPENFFSKQNVVPNLEEACKMAILAGVDIECGSAFSAHLADAVRHGLLKESDLDANLRAVFRAKYRLGLFDHPSPDKMVWDKLPEYDTPDHRALAREVSVEGSVLLRNEGHLLPLRKDLKVVAVIGPNADLAQTGDYSAKAAPGQLVTVLDGIRSHVSSGTQVLYARGCDLLSGDTTGIAEAVNLAAKADVVVLVVGDNSRGDVGKSTTGENIDGATLEIPGAQRRLIQAVYGAGKPVALVLVNGKPFTLAWEAAHIPAILETWYPGEEGGDATADLLFGDRNPSGRLPITFPRHPGQLPLNYDYLPSGRRYDYYDMPFSPQYRFGYGLSYTSFRYGHLSIKARPDDPGFVTVSADVTNTGNRDGDEVAQLYVTDMQTPVITPVVSLQGARRVSIKAGETRTVDFDLTPYQLSLLDADMNRVLVPGTFRVHVGGVCPAPPGGTDEHKEKIGFTDSTEGVSGAFTVDKTYKAEFTPTLDAPLAARGGVSFPVTVSVRNAGNLEDVTEIKVYGENLLDTYHMEVAPGVTKTHTFPITLYKSGTQTLTILMGGRVLTRALTVSPAPARLTLDHVRTVIGEDGVLRYSADAVNTGSIAYREQMRIRVDGALVKEQSLVLEPGERQRLRADYAFPRSGTYKVQIGTGEPTQVVVPGGIGLGLRNPSLYLTDGNVLQGNVVNTGGLDLYRKPFTLSAWVNVASLDNNGQAGFFGGQAPMGADVDNTGTALSAGVSKGRLLLSFWGRDLSGTTRVSVGEWVHVAYTYDPVKGQGALYLNGKLDKTGAQQPYAGQLSTIGASPRLGQGKFSMRDVVISRDCLDAADIATLYREGVGAFKEGALVTEWEPAASGTIKYWADVPTGSHIHLTLEKENVSDSLSVELHNGADSISVTGLHLDAGSRVRARIRLTAEDWHSAPVLQTLSMDGGPRWSMQDEWQKGTVSGGISKQPTHE